MQSSEYAELAGSRSQRSGLGAYLAIFATALLGGPGPAAIGAGLWLAGLVFGGSLLAIQEFVIEAFCLWCLLSALMLVLAVVAVLRRARGGTRVGGRPAPQDRVSFSARG